MPTSPPKNCAFASSIPSCTNLPLTPATSRSVIRRAYVTPNATLLHSKFCPNAGSFPSGKFSVVRRMSPLVSCTMLTPTAPISPSGRVTPPKMWSIPKSPYMSL